MNAWKIKKICYNKKYDMEKIVFETVNDCEIVKHSGNMSRLN